MGNESVGAFSVNGLIETIVKRGKNKPFGWRILDERDIGADPGDLVVVAGRTGHGKTTVVFNLLAHWLERYPEETYVIFSYELPPESIMIRMLSILTRMHGAVGWSYRDVQRCLQGGDQRVRPGLKVAELHRAVAELKSWEKRLIVVYQPDWNVIEVVRHCHEIAPKIPHLGAIFVDYLQLVGPPPGKYESFALEVAHTARQFKRLAVRLGCPVVAAAQIRGISIANTGEIPFGTLEDRRVLEFIAKRRPQLHHLADAGGEQEADLVLGILNYQADFFAVREEAGLEQLSRKETGNAAPFEVGVIKNRHGALGTSPLVLEAASGCIRDPGVFGR
jgi:replicative DNA helicase